MYLKKRKQPRHVHHPALSAMVSSKHVSDARDRDFESLFTRGDML